MLDLSIIIPFKDKSGMTTVCLDTLEQYGDAVKEIVLVSNNSSPGELLSVQKASKKYNNVRVLEYNKPFNFQAINNWAIGESSGKVCMMLNNDIELVVKSRGLLQHMYNQALESSVGAVGCVLLYGDQKTIQHAGVYLVAGGTADHLYIRQNFKKVLGRLSSKSSNAPDIETDLTVTAVTAAAVMIERKKFDEVKGLNENFIICGGDVDLCLRLEEKGYKSRLTGAKHGYIIHKESKSRSLISVPYVDFAESYRSYVKHFSIEKGDPCFSPAELKYA